MQVISSKENDIIKHIKKLKEKKFRDLNNEYIIEGIKLVLEAINENSKIKQIIVCENFEKTENISKEEMYEIAKNNCIYVTEKIFKYISQVQTPQGILAIIEKNNNNKNIDYTQNIIVALDNIQDPGNLGTILRTVDSVGLNQILISNKTADAYSPKVVRSTMGAIFRIKIIECENLIETLKQIQQKQFEIVVTSLQTEKTIYDINYNKKVIVVGNEANGVEKEIQELANEKIKIPMIRKNRKLKRICCNWNCII